MEKACQQLSDRIADGIKQIYSVAETGQVQEVKQTLDRLVDSLIDQQCACALSRQDIIRSLLGRNNENDSTALLAAARGNHIDLVIFLVDDCLVDIEQTGRVKSFQNNGYDRYVDDATALWISATGGHTDLVKELIKRHADLNHGTRTKSTPFRGACFHGHMEVIQTLRDAGCDINLPNDQMQTPLLTACATGQINVVRFLFKIGAKRMKESTGLNELFVAASYANCDIVKFLVDLTGEEYSVEEKIEALELAGASVIDADKGSEEGLELWKRALKMRVSELPSSLEKLQKMSAIEAYRCVIEPVTLDDLSALALDSDMMLMRALSVRERVMGTHHPFTAHQVRYRAVQYIKYKQYDRCIELMKHALELQNKVTCRLDSPAFEEDEIILVHARLFQYFSLKSCFPDVKPFFRNAVKKMKRAKESIHGVEERKDAHKTIGKLMISCLHLLAIWIKCLSESKKKEHGGEDDENEGRNVPECVSHLVSRLVSLDLTNETGQTFLHLACTVETRGTFAVDRRPMDFPSLPVIRCLIKCGHRLNIQDIKHETPFLLACKPKSQCQVEVLSELLAAGAYAHCRDIHGRTAWQLCEGHCDVEEWLSQYLSFRSLQTLAAYAVKDHLLSYVGHVPTSLHKFLDYH
jgi:ankyrin repeat protein